MTLDVLSSVLLIYVYISTKKALRLQELWLCTLYRTVFVSRDTALAIFIYALSIHVVPPEFVVKDLQKDAPCHQTLFKTWPLSTKTNHRQRHY